METILFYSLCCCCLCVYSLGAFPFYPVSRPMPAFMPKSCATLVPMCNTVRSARRGGGALHSLGPLRAVRGEGGARAGGGVSG